MSIGTYQLFFTLVDTREKLEQWRQDYIRPHSWLGDPNRPRSSHRYRAIRNDQAMLRGLGGTAEVERDLTQVSPLVERARDELRLWREHYNERRPRTSLGYVPPSVLLNRRRGTPAYQPGLLTPNSD